MQTVEVPVNEAEGVIEGAPTSDDAKAKTPERDGFA